MEYRKGEADAEKMMISALFQKENFVCSVGGDDDVGADVSCSLFVSWLPAGTDDE
jgi:hypothetical protein